METKFAVSTTSTSPSRTSRARPTRCCSRWPGWASTLLAFAAVPTGPHTTQLTLFPEDSHSLQTVAKKSGMTLIGPHGAFLVQGSDELGALVDVHKALYDADVNIFSSTASPTANAATGTSSTSGRTSMIERPQLWGSRYCRRAESVRASSRAGKYLPRGQRNGGDTSDGAK